jgi:hypothetical protein
MLTLVCLVNSPEYSQEVTWSPWANRAADEGVFISDLDSVLHGRKKYMVLRYSVVMKPTETHTAISAKLWSSKKMREKTGKIVAFYSKPESQEPIFQKVSLSLAQSFAFNDEILQNTQFTQQAQVGNPTLDLPATTSQPSSLSSLALTLDESHVQGQSGPSSVAQQVAQASSIQTSASAESLRSSFLGPIASKTSSSRMHSESGSVRRNRGRFTSCP